MSKIREFYVVDLGTMTNSGAALSSALNTKIGREVSADREVHFLQALSHDGHVFVFLRALQPAEKP